MRLKDVPKSPAYLVNHDLDGAMEIWPCATIEWAEQVAKHHQEEADNLGVDANWRAYTKLPRVRVFKVHQETSKCSPSK